MVIRALQNERRTGTILVDVMIAIALFTAVLLPIALTFEHEQRVARAYYNRAVAMEIIDGELEVLAAGAWKEIPLGEHDYAVTAESRHSLPAGVFRISRGENVLELAWVPEKRGQGRYTRAWALPKAGGAL